MMIKDSYRTFRGKIIKYNMFSSFEFLVLTISNVTVKAIRIPIKALSIELENKIKSTFDAKCV